MATACEQAVLISCALCVIHKTVSKIYIGKIDLTSHTLWSDNFYTDLDIIVAFSQCHKHERLKVTVIRPL